MRNKIITWLIILSSAGILFSIVTLVASFFKNLFMPGDHSFISIIIENTNNYNGLTVVLSILIIFLMTAVMLSDCKSRVWVDAHSEDMWKRILTSLPPVGAIAYHIMIVESVDLSLHFKFLKKRCFVKSIYFLSFVGTFLSIVIMLAIVTLIREPFYMKIALASVIVSMFTAALATVVLYFVATVDAASRSQEEWQKEDFLSYITSRLWIFGLRQYYLKYLLPRPS